MVTTRDFVEEGLTILRQLIAHPNQHLGQIDLLRGFLGLGGGLG